MTEPDKHTGVIPAPLETEVPSSLKKEASRGVWVNILQLTGLISVLGLLATCVSGIAPPSDPDAAVANTDTLKSNYFQYAHWTMKVESLSYTIELERWVQLQYMGTLQANGYDSADPDTTHTTYMIGLCDSYQPDDSRRLIESTHHHSIEWANVESKIAELTGKASDARRHLEKVSDECIDRDDECKFAGQGASALFAISAALVFANAIVTFMTMNGGDDTKTKISAGLHGLVILLTSVAVGLFTLDCSSLIFADQQEDLDEYMADSAWDWEYTVEYTNGATFSCGITVVATSVVLLALRLIPVPAQMVKPVKAGEEP